MVQLGRVLVQADSHVVIVVSHLVLFKIQVDVTTVEKVFRVGSFDRSNGLFEVLDGVGEVLEMVVGEAPVVVEEGQVLLAETEVLGVGSLDADSFAVALEGVLPVGALVITQT